MRPTDSNAINILIIEDNPADFHLLGKLLRSSLLKIGHLYNVSDIQEAKNELNKSTIDLILLSLPQSERSGIDSYLNIRTLFESIPVILLSAKNDENIAIEAIKNGVQDFLLKEEITADRLYKSIKYSFERNRNLIRLKESNERFSAVANATHDAVWDWDLKKNVIWWGSGFMKLFGYENEETGAEFWYNHIHPDDRERVINSIHNVIYYGGTKWSAEYRFKKADGYYVYIFDRGYTIRGEDGQTVKMVGSMMDITAAKNAEQELKESEERFRSLANQAPMFIWIAGADANVTYANKALLDYFGLTSYIGLTGQSWRQRVHPADEAYVNEVFSYAIELRKPYELECRMKSASGEYRWLFYKGVPRIMANGQFEGFIGTAIDIHDRKQAEASLLESEERLRIAVESTSLGTWDYYPITGDLIWSANCKKMFGLSTDDHIDYDLFVQAIHPEDRDSVLKEFQKHLTPGADVHFTIEFRAIGIKDKQLRWIQSTGRSFFNHDGAAHRLIGMMMDITQQKQARETLEKSAEMLEKMVQERTHELQNANENLKKSNAELEQFAYIASHDLQEPLRKILIFSDQLQSSIFSKSSFDEQVWLEKIRFSAKRMSILIKDLLEYSRLINKTEFVQFTSVDLNKVVHHIMTDLEVVIQQKGATVQVDNLPIVEAVEVQMNQLFYNLLSNSLKFIAQDRPSVIKIETSVLSEDERLKHNLRAGKDYCKIIFSDNGIGFNQEFAEQIFTIYKRLHTKDKYPGTGIGLALCRKVVENHNGVIYAEGKENEGAAFIVILPLQQLKEV
ncbi:PAS domain-containing protein [Chitinophagaceae bacterium LB-8]|uniref:histidine kinase n=1 Tax=Paraflavisolibacter caeni TaxID=2982496 RepID=A0A9X2XS48_9BACT|nr:PAS domain-containing protein [Paraflavisolibacter caeni]MCU7547620.1 PAS domain-containing protein [Paraflavisolibacter caeni]